MKMATLRRSLEAARSLRALSSDPNPSLFSTRNFQSGTDDIFGDAKGGDSPFESADDFEKRLFDSGSKNSSGNGAINDSFFKKLDRIERAPGYGRSQGMGTGARGRRGEGGDGMPMGFDSLADGISDKLKKAATWFQGTDETPNEGYAFRPDAGFMPGSAPRDFDLRRPGVPRGFRRNEFETTTAEVLKKADFRNVRFLANFITEAGIIIKRSQTKISAKAQRKVAREIKTARALGLMPFTLMGSKPFTFGKSMEDAENDYYDNDPYYGSNVDDPTVDLDT